MKSVLNIMSVWLLKGLVIGMGIGLALAVWRRWA